MSNYIPVHERLKLEQSILKLIDKLPDVENIGEIDDQDLVKLQSSLISCLRHVKPLTLISMNKLRDR